MLPTYHVHTPLVDVADQYLGLCEAGCGRLVFRLEHHLIRGHADEFDPLPWEPPEHVPDQTLRRAEQALLAKQVVKDRELAPFRYSLALLDFEHGTYRLAQPLRKTQPRPGVYFMPHAITCEAR